MAKKIVLTDNSGNKCYPVTRDECVKCGDRTLPEKFSELGIKVKYDNDLVKNESNTIIYNNSNKVKGNLIVTVLQNLTDYNKLNLAIIKKDGSKFYSSIDITNKSNLFRLDKYEDLEYIDFIYVSPISEENKGHLTIEICIGQVYTADDITNKTLDGLVKKDEQLQSSIDSNKANIEKDFNSKVFTNNFDANRVIRKLFIDTTNYSGSYSLEGLYIDIIARNISSQWGILVKNSEKQNIIAKWMQSEESIQSDVYFNGIYLYVEYNWDNMDDQSSVKGSPFLLTNEVFNKNNDPRNYVKEENIKDGSISKDKLNAILQEGFEKTAYIDGLNAKINEVLAYRDNLYENSLSPEIFPYNKESKNNFGCTIEIDTDSPFKDLIGFKRVFLNTMTENNTSCYYRQRIYSMKKSKPNSINIAFWTKESEFTSIFESHFEFWISTEMKLNINPSNAYDGIPVETKITGGTNYIKSSNGKFSILEKKGDYMRVLIEFTNIVWFEGFNDTALDWYFLFNGTENKDKLLTIIDFTILLDEKIASGVMYPDTNNLVGSPTLQSVQNLALENRKRIDVLEKNNEGDIKLKFRDNYVFIARDWSDDEYLVSRININRKASVDNNPNINFEQDYLANKQGGIDVSSKSIKDCGDDICPANIFGSYIGGNHGWNMPYKVISSAHGKTVKDVGAIYRDSDGVEFVILRYTDENNLHIISKNQSTDGFSYSFKKPTGTLTYVSNGESQTELTVESAVEDGNFHPSTTESKKQFFVDGKLRTDENSCNIFDIIESYDVVDLISAIDKIVSNRPSNGYDENPFLPNLDGVEFLFNHTICYRFTSDGNITINTTFKPYKKLRLNFHGFVQAGALSQGNIYIPKTKEISGYDFTKYGVNWTNPPSEAINIRPDNWENTESAPDRIVNYNDDVNFMIGYITDRAKVGKGRKNYVSDRAIFLWTSRKLYPMGIDKIGNLDALANESYSLIGYRCYTNPSKLNGRTNIAKLKVGTDIFIFLDYHKSMIDTVELDYSYGGKEIQVYEKNERCLLLDEVVIGNSFRVQSMADVDNYGYIVLKIVM